MVFRVILDVVIIALLGVGIFYAWRLERQLRALDRNRQEMEKFVGTFSSAVTRAEKGIRELQDTAQDTGVDVDRHIARAGALKDELHYLIDAADKIAAKLTDVSSEALNRKAAVAPVVVAEPPPPPLPPKVEVVPPPLPTENPGPPPVPPWARRANKDQVVIRQEKPAGTPLKRATEALQDVAQMAREKPPSPPLRSAAERDLQQALEKIR